MSSFDPLGLRPNDPLEKWRDAVEKQEREFAQARRQREEEQRRHAEAAAANEAARLREAFDQRLAALEARNADLETWLVDVARATAHAFNELADQRVDSQPHSARNCAT